MKENVRSVHVVDGFGFDIEEGVKPEPVDPDFERLLCGLADGLLGFSQARDPEWILMRLDYQRDGYLPGLAGASTAIQDFVAVVLVQSHCPSRLLNLQGFHGETTCYFDPSNIECDL